MRSMTVNDMVVLACWVLDMYCPVFSVTLHEWQVDKILRLNAYQHLMRLKKVVQTRFHNVLIYLIWEMAFQEFNELR